MKKSLFMSTIVVLLILGLASFTAAQMMGSGHDHSAMNKADSGTQSAMMSNMSQQCKMMSTDLENLKIHFDKMMQMDNMRALKAEMGKYQEMLQTMSDNMSQHQTMCMNMIGSGEKMDKMGCCSMMDNNNKNSGN